MAFPSVSLCVLQASSGVKQWNKRWFVLVDRCLFYYKDEKEESILGSIPLLSFRVAAVQPSDNISRKHTFKVSWASSSRWEEDLGLEQGKGHGPQESACGGRAGSRWWPRDLPGWMGGKARLCRGSPFPSRGPMAQVGQWSCVSLMLHFHQERKLSPEPLGPFA